MAPCIIRHDRFRPRGTRGSLPVWVAVGWLIFAVLQPGCVALNLPSERHHDPVDRGGPLGPWRPLPGVHPPLEASPEQGAWNEQGGAWCGENFDAETRGAQGAAPPESEPEVPWPRFHPVPTRPVFGPSSH